MPAGLVDLTPEQPADSLTAQIHSRDKAVTVGKSELPDGPRRVILLMDLSGSMDADHPVPGDQIWLEARQLAQEFLTSLRPGDAAALHAFADRHQVVAPLTEDLTAVVRAVDELPRPATKQARALAGFRTVYGDAVREAVRHESNHLAPGDVILLLSDGYGYPGKTGVKSLVVELSQKGLRVFLLRVGPPPRFHGESAWSMADLAAQTGGFFMDTWTAKMRVPGYEQIIPIDPPSPERIRTVAQMAHGMVRAFTWVELKSTRCDGRPMELKLEVKDGNGRRLERFKLVYPRYAVFSANGEAQGN